ncbi:MAG: GNAT family N-acetyltransferase [Patescibacteria group bacterium]
MPYQGPVTTSHTLLWPKIIKAKPQDAYAVQALKQEVWLATYPNLQKEVGFQDVYNKAVQFTTVRRVMAIAEQLTSNTDKVSYVIREGSEVVGLIHISTSALTNRLIKLYIKPRWQGKGLGKRLMNFALKKMKNGKPITLSVARANTRAVRFYQKYGFTIAGEGKPIFFSKNASLPTYEMIKRE